MKLKYCVLPLALLMGVLLWPAQQARSQGDTLTVEWWNGTDIIKNALVIAVLNDTARPAGRVYKLKKGGYYWNEETITNTNWHLRIVGEPAGAAADQNPPVLQIIRRSDQTVNQRMITAQSSVTLKNLWITGADDGGVQTAYQPVQVEAQNATITIDNCIFDRSNFSIVAFTSKNNKLFFTNNKYRNLIGRPSTQQWEGRGISVWADQDTVVVENNTFFNIGFTAFQMESGAIKYLRFNHNTLVNIGRNFLTGGWWREAYFANNLIVNGFWHGEGINDQQQSGRDARAYNTGMWNVGPLPAAYGPEKGRRILFANTASWRDPAITAHYGDSIRVQPYVNNVTKLDFLDRFPNIKIQDTTWLAARPNFPTYPDTLIPKMWANINDIRTGVNPATSYFYALPTDAGQELYTSVAWPLPEDFSYTTPSLLTAGTDNLPLGDLNWFPTSKATFLANHANYVSQLEEMAGERLSFSTVATLEAEKGTPANGAAVVPYGTGASDFTYFAMDGGGFFEWTFNVATAGQCSLKVQTHMRNQNQRGQHTFVNGVEIHDASHGWGELIYDNAQGVTNGMVINDWTWVTWKQSDLNEAGALTLVAGENKIKMSSSWGYQDFAGVDVMQGANVIHLRATDVTDYAIVSPRQTGAPWVPAYFKAVSLGTNGTITWTVNAPKATRYALAVFYQNFGSTSIGSLEVDGTVVSSLPFDRNSDSTGLNMLSDFFTVSTGSHTLKLTGSGVSVDFVQFTEVVTAVNGENELPGSFELAQNYPNPFNPSTTINFVLGKTSNVTLSVFNILGQKVATLVDGPMAVGSHTVHFNGKSLASGVYIYRLETPGFVSSKKMMFLK